MRIRRGDMVEVITGADRSVSKQNPRRGRVMRVLVDEKKLIVEGVAEVQKHIRRSRKNPQGGRLTVESAIDVSNVMVVCGKCSKPTRVGMKIKDDGTKVRVCKRCEAEIG